MSRVGKLLAMGAAAAAGIIGLVAVGCYVGVVSGLRSIGEITVIMNEEARRHDRNQDDNISA